MLDEHLVTVGVFVGDTETSRYYLTELGRQLRSDATYELRDELDITSAIGRAELAFVELLHTVTTGQPAYPQRDHTSTATVLRRQDEQAVPQSSGADCQNFNWSRFRHIVDVGGGDGTVLGAILLAHPTLTGRVLDLPPTAAAAAQKLTEAGLDSRATAVAGSFFDPLPGNADAYLLSDILHNWDDDDARTILARCAQAAAPHGTVLVIEALLGHCDHTAIDLFMMMCFGGRERSVDELTTLAGHCGLTLRGRERLADQRLLLEFAVHNSPQD